MSTEIQHTNSSLDTSQYVEFGDRYLTFQEDTPFEVWSEVVHRLKSAEKSIQWWLGDTLRFGEARYGEMYSQALEETDYAYGTLRNAAWVAGKVELSRRNDRLPYSHHVAVAPFPPEEQERLLTSAEPLPGETKPQKTAGQLREEGRAPNGKVETATLTRACPQCGGTGEVPVE